MKKAVVLDPRDNVATVLEDVSVGEEVSYQIENETKAIKALENIPRGHKIALRDISRGNYVVKYGFPIGCATKNILKGEHVHVHNVSSLRTRKEE
jgi:altronate dehydratase small subunit